MQGPVASRLDRPAVPRSKPGAWYLDQPPTSPTQNPDSLPRGRGQIVLGVQPSPDVPVLSSRDSPSPLISLARGHVEDRQISQQPESYARNAVWIFPDVEF